MSRADDDTPPLDTKSKGLTLTAPRANSKKLNPSSPPFTPSGVLFSRADDATAPLDIKSEGLALTAARAKRHKLNPSSPPFTPGAISSSQANDATGPLQTKSNVLALKAEGLQTTHSDSNLPDVDEKKNAEITRVFASNPDRAAQTRQISSTASSSTPMPTALHHNSNNLVSQSDGEATTKPDPTPALQSKGQKLPANPRPTPAADPTKSHAPASPGRNKEAATDAMVAHSAVRPTPQAKRTESAHYPGSRPNFFSPMRKNVTPSQAYAGPAFLASPLASSLPKPSLFSRSYPDLQRSPSLKPMQGQTGNPSDRSEESPTLRKSTLGGAIRVTASSPADISSPESPRNESRTSKKDDASIAAHDSSADLPPCDLTSFVRSSLSPKRHVFHHARNTTDGSIEAVFPVEIDNRSSPSPKPRQELRWARQSSFPANPQAATSAMLDRSTLSSDEARKARSLELKRLLTSPILPNRSHSAPSDQPEPHTRTRLDPRGSTPPPVQVEDAEARKQLSPPLSGHVEWRPQHRGFHSAISPSHSHEPQLPGQGTLSREPAGSPTTSSVPGVIATAGHQYQTPQLIPAPAEQPLGSKLIPNGPTRSHSSPSNLHQQASSAKKFSRTELLETLMRLSSPPRDSSRCSPVPWNRCFMQYRDISPYAPCVLDAHRAHFNIDFDKISVRDPEVTRSMGEYLQRVIS